MRRKIPSTGALIAFEAAARHQSFTKAAAELALTQSAICRQIASLEEFLKLRLFRRSKRGVTLTEAGIRYSRQVAQRLNTLERDTLELMAGRGLGGTLELAVVPTFATQWLVPRLAEFQRLYPHISVNLTTRTRVFLFEDSGFDAAIYSGDGVWPGCDSHYLFAEEIVPVCSPQLIAPHTTLEAHQLAQLPLLQQTTRPYAWRQWFESLALQVEHDLNGPRYELFSMLSQAAVHGMGVALIPRFLIEDELSDGRLIIPMSHQWRNQRAYYLVHPEHQAESERLKLFQHWLLAQARGYSASIPNLS